MSKVDVIGHAWTLLNGSSTIIGLPEPFTLDASAIADLDLAFQTSRVDWTPAELASPFAPRAWFAADRITGLADGDPVTTWEDLSDCGADATTEGDDPTYRTNVQASLPGVEFALNELATALSASHQDEVLYAVIIVESLDSNGVILNALGGGRAYVAEAATQKLIVRKVGAPHITLARSSQTIDLGVPILVGYRMTADDVTMSYNGASDAPILHAQTFTGGLTSFLGTAFNGSILEIVTTPFESAFEDQGPALTATIEGYLAHKWGLSRDLPTDHLYKYSPPPSAIRPADILGPSATTLIADLDTLYVPLGAINAKGDLLVGGANDIVNNLPLGGTGQMLVVNPDAVSGMAWANQPTPTWHPDLLGASLLGWLKPEAIITPDGDPIAVWLDSSGNDADTSAFSDDNRPIYRADLLNGYGGVDFDGVDNFLQWTDISASSTDETLFAVVDVDSLASARAIVGASDNGGREYRVGTDGTLSLVAPFVANIDTTTATISINTPAIVGFTLGASTGSEFINGTTETFSHAVSLTAARTTLLGLSGLSDIYDGVIYEVIACTTLSAANVARVEGYLAHKYALTASLPSTHPYKTHAPHYAPWVLEGSAAWNIADTATATAASTTLAISGAEFGDVAVAAVDTLGANNWMLSAHVQASGTVRVVAYNVSGGNLNPADGTLTVKVIKSP